VTQGKGYTSVLEMLASSSQMIYNTVEMCAAVRWIHVSACFWGGNGL